jgi:ABC-2 type transport system ATP-binding protein
MFQPAIEVLELTKKYRKQTALDRINLSTAWGEVFGLAGPNGAGKSTLLAIIATVVLPTDGEVYVNGFSVLRNKEKIRPLIGYVPQDVALYPTLSGLDNLKFWAQMYNLGGRLRKSRISKAVEMIGIGDRITDKVDTYSGGMKKRLNIAVSLLHNPRILIMDEPTAGVDAVSRKYITGMIRSFAQKGKTVIFSSHYMDDMEGVCDRIALLESGKLKSFGSVGELKSKFGKESIADIMMSME